jgi:hypothetical protein
MRFLFKKPPMDQIAPEIDVVMSTMVSEAFIFIDLFWYSIFFTFFLAFRFPSAGAIIMVFTGIYLSGSILYFLINLFVKKLSSNVYRKQ